VARSVGTRYCVLHVNAPLDARRAWNEARPKGERYSAEM
jgi:tRNA uridine 5-carbamoylmethylation protein Kti12